MVMMREVSALPRPDFDKAFGERMARGLWKRAAWVRPADELMKEARELAEARGTLSLPPPSTQQPVVSPLRAEKLEQNFSDPPLYSREKSQEMIATRYARLLPFARRIAPDLMTDRSTRELLLSLHKKGMKDWEIISILMNMALQQRTEALMGGPIFGDGMERASLIMQEEAAKLMADEHPTFDRGRLTDKELRFQEGLFTMALSRSWRLANNRNTPDFDAIRELLNKRFHQAEDDMPHDDIFNWSAFASEAAGAEPDATALH